MARDYLPVAIVHAASESAIVVVAIGGMVEPFAISAAVGTWVVIPIIDTLWNALADAITGLRPLDTRQSIAVSIPAMPVAVRAGRIAALTLSPIFDVFAMRAHTIAASA